MCYDELTIMMYADGELGERERRDVGAHLDRCARCGTLVAALRIETRVLTEALGEGSVIDTDVAGLRRPVQAYPARVRVAAAWAIVVVSTAAVRFLVESVGAAPVPDVLGWLSPFRVEGQVNLVFSAAAHLVEEGGAIMSSLVTAAGLSSCVVLMLSAVSTMAGRVRRRSGLACLVAVGVLASAASADAMTVRRAQGALTIPTGETVDDTLVAIGDSIDIDGTVTGDVIAMARRVRVRGTVRGTLVALAQDVDVDGTVEGSILQLGRTLTNRGQTNGNLYAFGQTIAVSGNGRIGGNATTFSETATIEGTVGYDVTSFGRAVSLGGTVGRGVTAYADRVDVRAGARIDRSLTAHVRDRDNVRVDSGATIGGGTTIDVREPEPSRYLTTSFYVRQVIRLAAAFLTGWILFWLVPRAAGIRLDTGGLLTAAGAGAVAVVATPILAFVVCVTLIGIPLAVFALLLWVILLYLAKIVLALILGRIVLGSNGSRTGIAAALLVGLALVIAAVNLPYVGGIINILLTVTGFGVALVEMFRWYKGASGVPASA